MTTTLKISTQGKIMEAMFEQAKELSIRFYKPINLMNENDYDYDQGKTYQYLVTIRHPEGTNARQLFNKESKQLNTSVQ